LTFIQVERKIIGKNSLDAALFEAALFLQKEGIQHFIIVTTDTDFVEIVKELKKNATSYILGIGGISSNKKLRTVYDEFLYYPPNVLNKVLEDAKIPKGEPNEKVREYLLKAYSQAKKSNKWIPVHLLGSEFKILFPDFAFPKDHPNKFRLIIKIYHTSFEWKRNGKQILVKRIEGLEHFL
jgi:hypothetical protein